jgi:hypothetical protein
MIPHLEASPPLLIGNAALNATAIGRVAGSASLDSKASTPLDRDGAPLIRRSDAARPGRPFTNLSQESQTLAQETQSGTRAQAGPTQEAGADSAETASTANGHDQNSDPDAEGADGLTEAERRKVRELEARDRQVREHERAHQVTGGQYASSPSFRTVRGPDGRSYAVGGEVRIDTSPIPGNPEATIRKMQIVKRAALAPQEPSSADRAVAARAEAAIVRARAEIRERQIAESREQRRDAAEQPDLGDSKSAARTPGGELVFDPSRRFLGDAIGTGEIQNTIALPSALASEGAGVLDPGQLLSLVA